MPTETMGEDLPPPKPDLEASTTLEARGEATPQIEVIYAPNSEELELQALDQNIPSDPWSVVPPDPMSETGDLDPDQLTRVEETGLETHKATKRIQQLLDPVQGNQKDDPAQIIIRHLRRVLRRMEAIEKGLQQVEVRLEALEEKTQNIGMQLSRSNTPSEEMPDPFG